MWKEYHFPFLVTVGLWVVAGIAHCGTALAANEYEPDVFTIFLWHLDSPQQSPNHPWFFEDAGRNRLPALPGKSRVTPIADGVKGLGNAVQDFRGDRLLRTGPSDHLMPGARGFTFELWLRDPLTGEGWQNLTDPNAFSVIAQYRAQNIQWWLTVRHRDRALIFRTIAEGNNFIYGTLDSGPLSWHSGTWYHLAATCQPSADQTLTLRLYRTAADGPSVTRLAEQSVASPEADRVIPSVLREGMISIGGAGTGARMLGSGCAIDEIRYSSIARTPADFAEHLSLPQ